MITVTWVDKVWFCLRRKVYLFLYIFITLFISTIIISELLLLIIIIITILGLRFLFGIVCLFVFSYILSRLLEDKSKIKFGASSEASGSKRQAQKINKFISNPVKPL